MSRRKSISSSRNSKATTKKNRFGKSVTPKRTPHRDIDKDGVTYSFLAEFLTDRECARMTYVEGYQESGIIGAMEFGQCFHACLEATAANRNSPPSASQIVKDYIDTKAKYDKLKRKEIEELELLGSIVSMMFPLYFDFWKKNKGIEFSPQAEYVAWEEKFEVPHTFPYHFNSQDGTITQATLNLRGRWDAVFRHNGRLWLMENKTKSQIDTEGLTASLAMDTQTMMYCQAIRLRYGECPAGVLYNVIKRPGHRFGVKDTKQSYLSRIQDAVVSSPDDYFMRWHVDITESELEEWVTRSLNPILCHVKRWWDSIKANPFNPWSSPEHFVNPEALYTRYGRSKYFDYLTRKSTYGLKRTTRKK